MVDEYDILVAGLLAAGLIAVAEGTHALRVQRAAPLAFARPWGRGVSAATGIARLGAILCFALAAQSLWRDPASSSGSAASVDSLLIVIDVSGSMGIEDAGPGNGITREQRAHQLISRLLEDWQGIPYRGAVVAFATTACRVIPETRDPAVLANLFATAVSDLGFLVNVSGDTNLLSGVREALALAEMSPNRPTTLVVLSDGESLPDAGDCKRPSNIRRACVVGVGSRTGVQRPGSQDFGRQDHDALADLAVRLGGRSFDGNEEFPPASFWSPPPRFSSADSPISWARVAVGVALVLLWAIPLLQQWGQKTLREVEVASYSPAVDSLEGGAFHV